MCNVDGVVGGPTGCTGLSPGGVKEAEALRDRLVASRELAGAAAVYASVLPRALETGRHRCPGPAVGLVAVPDCGLCELHPGEADGLTWTEFTDRYGGPNWDEDPDAVLAPGGESWTGFVRRVATVLTETAARHRGELVVIVCHGGVVEASIEALLPVDAGPRAAEAAHGSHLAHRMGAGSRRMAAAALQRRRPPDGGYRLIGGRRGQQA